MEFSAGGCRRCPSRLLVAWTVLCVITSFSGGLLPSARAQVRPGQFRTDPPASIEPGQLLDGEDTFPPPPKTTVNAASTVAKLLVQNGYTYYWRAAQLYGLQSTFESPAFAGTVLAFTDVIFEASAAQLQLCPELLLSTPRAMAAVMQYSVLPPPARPFSGFVPGDQLATSYGVQTVSVGRDASASVTLGSFANVVRMQSVNMQAGGALVHTTSGVLMPYLY